MGNVCDALKPQLLVPLGCRGKDADVHRAGGEV